MRIVYFYEKLLECDVFSVCVFQFMEQRKDLWWNKVRCGIVCIGIKIKIFYSSWKIYYNIDVIVEWKFEFLVKRIKVFLCFICKQISVLFLGVIF